MILLAYCFLASLALLAKASVVSFESGPGNLWPLPSGDPFYRVPQGIDGYKPGDIINYRFPPFPIGAFGDRLENVRESYQISYRTTDSYENPTSTILTVLVPHNPDHSKVLSFQTAEDAATIDCAPSFAFQLVPGVSDKLRSSAAELQVWLIQAALAQGWVVIAPDFQGPNGAYAAGKIAAYATLDGIRAALRSGFLTGIQREAKVVLWGYSGGAGVTQGAASHQPTYAPELKIAGAAFGGVGGKGGNPLDLNKSPDAGLLPAAMLGLAGVHPDIEKLLDQSIKPEFRELFFSPKKQCLEANLQAFDGKDVIGMFKDGTLEPVMKAIAKALDQEDQGSVTPDVPMFLYQTAVDSVSPIAIVDDMVKAFCNSGAVIHYLKDEAAGVTHRNYGLIGAPKALEWMKDVMAGKLVQRVCQTNIYNQSTLDPAFLDLYSPKIRQALLELVPNK